MTYEWPCLSFDVIRDQLGASRRDYPLTAYFVTATQAEEDEANQIIVNKISGLMNTKNDGSAEEDLPDPKINCVASFHPSTANRVRSMPQQSNVVATWTESTGVMIWDVSAAIAASNVDGGEGADSLIFEIPREEEGFGLQWSPKQKGLLAIGDNTGVVALWEQDGSSFRNVNEFKAHDDSVEDITFAENDPVIFATCSGDGYVCIWDMRDTSAPVAKFIGRSTENDPKEKQGDNIDINVLSWNTIQTNLIATGSDDGQICVFDIRDTSEPSFHIDYHQDAITSIEWNPNDESELAAACAEGRVTIWDLSAEALDPEEREEGIPDQLMFEHITADPKELHYHPQIPSLVAVTGAETFDVFIPDIVEDAPIEEGEEGEQ